MGCSEVWLSHLIWDQEIAGSSPVTPIKEIVMIVYVVTKGEYSDYGICAVTLDKDKADELCHRFSDSWGDAYIETYDTDDYDSDKGRFYQVKIGKRSLLKVREIGVVGLDERNRVFTDTDRRTHTKYYFVNVKTKDEEHAKKIGSDLVAKYKAQEQGI